MDLHFITGRAGSGKSQMIVDWISKEAALDPAGPPIILIVPDQAAFTMETWLTAASVKGALVRSQVLSFRRLAFLARSDMGERALTPLRAAGKYALFAQAFSDVADQLHVLSRQDASSHYLERLLYWLEECQLYNHSPNDLAQSSRVASIDPFLAAKLSDMSMLYEAYQKRLAKTFVDPYDLLPFLARHAHAWPFLQEAHIFIDGFIGFTAQELQVISALATTPVASLTVTIGAPLDALSFEQKPLSFTSPFAQAQDTFYRLLAAIEQVTASKPRVTDLAFTRRFAPASRIAHIERQLFCLPGKKYEPLNDHTELDLVLAQATTKQAEVYGAVADLLELKRKHGYRFSDFSFIVPRLSEYSSQITQAFSEANIPFYMDERRTLRHHPLAVFLLFALRTASAGMSSDAVFRLLKTDLFPMSRATVDRLENHVLAHGISGQDWFSPFSDAKLGQPDVEQARQVIAGVMGEFVQKLSGSFTVRTLAHALWNLLDRIDASRTITRWITQAQDKGDLVLAQMHEKSFGAIVEALDDFVAALGDDVVTTEQAQDLVSRVFDGVSVGLIPAQVDQVLITEVNRVRAWESEAVFILGCVQGAFPKSAVEDDVLSDAEREWLFEMGTELGPSSSRKQLFERYRVYMAMTRAKRHLTLSYPVTDRGKVVSPSSLMTEIRFLFAERDVPWHFYRDEPANDDEADYRLCLTPHKMASTLSAVLREAKRGQPVTPLWYAAYDILTQNPILRDTVKRYFVGLNHRVFSESLPPAVAHELFGTDLTTSVSRLERFAQCSFAHFAMYGLRLKERERLSIDQASRGTLMHDVLHEFATQLKEEEQPWGALSDDEVRERLYEIFTAQVRGFRHQVMVRSARARHEAKQVYTILLRTLLVLTEHARRSAFVPYQTELVFGDGAGDHAPSVPITLSRGTLRLRGRIDRVDIAPDTDKLWYRVVDYKSSEHKLSFAKMYYGLMLQLPLYARVVERMLRSVFADTIDFAGMFYFPMIDPIQSVPGPTVEPATTQLFRKGLRMRGLLKKDPRLVRLLDTAQEQGGATDLYPKLLKKDGNFSHHVMTVTSAEWRQITDYVAESVVSFAEQILDGETAINPYRLSQTDHACAFCSFHALCHFEPQHKMGSYRLLPQLSKDQTIVLLEQKEGGSATDANVV